MHDMIRCELASQLLEMTSTGRAAYGPRTARDRRRQKGDQGVAMFVYQGIKERTHREILRHRANALRLQTQLWSHANKALQFGARLYRTRLRGHSRALSTC